MGSTGKSGGSGVSATTPAVSGGLASGADQQTITKYYKDSYGIDVGGSYFRDGLDPQILVETSKVLDKLTEELGKDIMSELGVRIVSYGLRSGVLGQTNLSNHKITVSTKDFQSLDGLDRAMARNVAAGFSPKNSKGADVIIHELGHNLEFLINRRVNGNDMLSLIMADSDQTFAKALVQQAYAEITAADPKKYASEKKARESISGYAATRWHGAEGYTETMAEAVADYGRNGKNASPMSIKIWEGIKAMLK